MRKYTLTKYFLLDLLAEALSTDETGKRFIGRPGSLLGDPISQDTRSRIRIALGNVLKDLVVDLNYEIDEREDEGHFDYKRVLKSPSEVRSLRRAVLSSYEKVVQRGRASSFGQALTEVGDCSIDTDMPGA